MRKKACVTCLYHIPIRNAYPSAGIGTCFHEDTFEEGVRYSHEYQCKNWEHLTDEVRFSEEYKEMVELLS